MKKTTRVLLWGCGGLLLLVLVLVGGALLYLSRQLDGVVALEEVSQSVSQRFEALERDFPFSMPDSGVFAPTDEERLLRYLRVRKSLLDGVKQMDALSRQVKEPNSDVEVGISAASELAKRLAGMPAEFASALEKEGMSAREFRAMTDAIYRNYLRPLLTAEKAQVEVEDMRKRGEELKDEILQPGMSDEEMRAINQQLALLKAQQSQVETTSDAGAASAPSNALLDRHRADIESLAHEMLDSLGM